MDTDEEYADIADEVDEMSIVDETNEEIDDLDYVSRREARRRLNEKKRKAIASQFLGKKEMTDASVILPRYYGELLTWALNQHIERDGWNIVKTVGFHSDRPVYIDVDTGSGKTSNLLRDGTMIIENGQSRFAATVDVNLEKSNSVVVTGSTKNKEQIDRFADDVKSIAAKENFYKGQKLELRGRISFLNLPKKLWSSLILDESFKEDIWANTIGFLSSRDHLKRLGVPIKRGVLLVGEPGTGKTLSCKALMAKASGITCIIASIDALDCPPYIYELYELAQDLSPAIVFIEDIDLIALEREEFGYGRGSSLLTLLTVLDGVEERDGVITIATTNCRETLDKAIAKRPSRFDRIIHFEKPTLHLRERLVATICPKIPLENKIQRYVALKTDNFTPAQIQEVVYTLAIEHSQNNPDSLHEHLDCSLEQVDRAIEKISVKSGRPLGFNIPSSENGQRLGPGLPIHNNKEERRQGND